MASSGDGGAVVAAAVSSSSSAAAAAAAATPAVAAPATTPFAPRSLLPPFLPPYLPSHPFPSVVDAYKQPPSHLSSVSGLSPSGEVTRANVRKRYRVLDGVRTAARKKKRDPSGSTLHATREIPDTLDLHVAGSGLIQQLLAMERRIDATLSRKQIEIQHALQTPGPKQSAQVLRLWMWHELATGTVEERATTTTASALDRPERSCWMLKLQGQILDAEDGLTSSSSVAPLTRCLSNWLSRLVIEVHAPEAPSDSEPSDVIEWRKSLSPILSDGFELRRLGDGSDLDLTIKLYLDHSPPRFRPSAQLAQTLGLPLYAKVPLAAYSTPSNPNPFPYLDTESALLESMWSYIHNHKLFHPSKPDQIQCDTPLKQLFGGGLEELPVSNLLGYLHCHLTPASAEPIVIPYRLTPSQSSQRGSIPSHMQSDGSFSTPVPPPPCPSHVSCYDILTYAPILPNLLDVHREVSSSSGPGGMKGAAGPPPPPPLPALLPKMSERLEEWLVDMDRSNRRREFLRAFSAHPIQVLNLLVAHEAKDTMLMTGVTGMDDEIERRAEFFHPDWLYDAVDTLMKEEGMASTNALQHSANIFAAPQEAADDE